MRVNANAVLRSWTLLAAFGGSYAPDGTYAIFSCLSCATYIQCTCILCVQVEHHRAVVRHYSESKGAYSLIPDDGYVYQKLLTHIAASGTVCMYMYIYIYIYMLIMHLRLLSMRLRLLSMQLITVHAAKITEHAAKITEHIHCVQRITTC